MISVSIGRKIMSIAVALIFLMIVTAALSMVSVVRVGNRLEEITEAYIPAYGNLARANIRSLERAVTIRRLVIEKLQPSSNAVQVDALRQKFDAHAGEVDKELVAAQSVIRALIEKGSGFGDSATLGQFESRIKFVNDDARRRLNLENARLFEVLETGDARRIDEQLDRIDELRDELNQKLDGLRADMLVLLRKDAEITVSLQHRVIVIAGLLTVLATILGLLFATRVSRGMTKPVRLLLERARSVGAGNLEEALTVTSQDEIGHLTIAFNQMVEQLRQKERIRETFGKYVDPRVVQGLIEGPTLGVEGQRRVMTVLFCDIKGFTGVSEGMTPAGLVKVMNRYFSTMSTPIRTHRGIIDKYIGDAIMAYWGPPFTEAAEHAELACSTAIDMLQRVAPLQAEIPELLGLRSLQLPIDLRIGIATGEVLVGSIGSELMMSYTVMGDPVNLASRLEGANKLYGTRILVSEETIEATKTVDAREIDRIVLLGQSQPQTVFEIMGLASELTPEQDALRSRFAEGLGNYRRRQWKDAKRAFLAALEAVPNDGPSMTFIRRIEQFETTPPKSDWDGSWHMNEK